MNLRVTDAPLPGVKLIDVTRHTDQRGWFAEVWNAARYHAAGLDADMVQQNVSWSRAGTLRGMHFQSPHEQGKLVGVLLGRIFDAVIDVRAGSPTFGQWYGCELSDANGRQLWVPEGFAHGFLVLSDALVQYGCTAPYHAASDRSLRWDDPRVGVAWPEPPSILSPKDRDAPTLDELQRQGLLPGTGPRPATSA